MLVVRCGLMAVLAIPVQLSAQNVAGKGQHHHYKLIDIDRHGRRIDPAVLAAAEGIYPRLLNMV
jgi:hypothetical protein